MFDRRLAQNFDWGLLSITIALGGLGLVVLYSAVTADSAGHSSVLFTRQIMWFLCGFIPGQFDQIGNQCRFLPLDNHTFFPWAQADQLLSDAIQNIVLLL